MSEVGFYMMFLGLFLVFRPLAIVADVLPMFGTLLSAGIGLFAFLGAAVLAFITIAIAWVVVRPLLGISLLVLAAGGVFWLLKGVVELELVSSGETWGRGVPKRSS